MSRKYFETEIEHLERLVKGNLHSRTVLAEIHEELTRRGARRAVQLRKEVKALLDGVIPTPPRPPRPESPDDQLEMLDDS